MYFSRPYCLFHKLSIVLYTFKMYDNTINYIHMKGFISYESPTMEVVELGQEEQLMQLSGIPDYGNGGDPLNP